MSERYWYIGWMHTLPTVKGNRLVIYLIVTRKKLRFVQSLPWQTCSWAFFSKGSLSILDFMQVCPCDQRHSNAFHLFIRFYSAPQLSIVISPSWNLLSIFRLWLLIALTVSIVTAWLFPMSAYFPFPLFFIPPPPSPSRSFTRPIFRAVFDSRSSFFAPKPHRNACYASYFTSHTVDIWMMLRTISSPGVENETTLGTRLNNVMSSVMSRFPTAAILNVKIGRVLRQHHFSCFLVHIGGYYYI